MAKIDLTGQRFGMWTVLEETAERDSSRNIMWKCKCDCGTIRNVSGHSLRRGKSLSCGCTQLNRSVDMIGQKFGMLTVLKRVFDPNVKEILWECKCDCGNTCVRSTSTLKRKTFSNCGCYNISLLTKDLEDLTNQHFGKLTVLKLSPDRNKFGARMWECQCECGNKIKVDTKSLKSGNTTSCGCINYSIGEKNINDVLTKNNIIFSSQYTEPSLNKKKFDFAIYDNNKVIRLIEFDGIQHFNGTRGMWDSTETVEDIQARDRIKDLWAKEHNIPLVRIPYWERDNITLDMLLGDQYLIKGDA